jgi:hypothetical protein
VKRSLAVILIASAVVSGVVALIGSLDVRESTGDSHPLRAKRVVVFSMPGVTWSNVRHASMPTFHKLMREGATAALAPRSASVRPSAERGFLTLGAGNRGAAANESSSAQLAYRSDEEVAPGVDAARMFHELTGRTVSGAVVHLGVPELQGRQDSEYHGAVVGALGSALVASGKRVGVVSAADQTIEIDDAHPPSGASALAVVDEHGQVRTGVMRGLVAAGGGGAFGVRTDRRAFREAARTVMDGSDVVLLEAGETLRADEFAKRAEPDRARQLRKLALGRTDGLLRDVWNAIGPRDLLLVIAPSSSSADPQEHLTPIVAWGAGTHPGELVSATTHRAGTVTLTDVAPTILTLFGIESPSSMSGRPIRQVESGAVRPLVHDELDQRSVFREGFVPGVFYSFVALFVLLFLLVALVFLLRLPLQAPLVGVCYLILALPLATFILSAVPLWKIGVIPAHVTLWSVAIVIAGAGWLVPGPRWTGALPLLVATASFVSVVLVFGGALLSNAVFGNSVLAAGRFYGIPNTGSALFFGASVLTVTGLGELWTYARRRAFLVAALVVVLVLTGFPMFGADVGGLLTGVAAGAVIVLAARGGRIPWRTLVVVMVVAGGVTLLVAYLDSLRALDQQTHLGRFASELFSGGGTASTTIMRKAQQAFASLSFSRFTYAVPFGVAALAVMMRRPRGPLRDVLATHRLFRAGLIGLLVAGVLGFALNDSGVAIPALLLGQAVPLVVLLGLDHMRSRSGFELDG